MGVGRGVGAAVGVEVGIGVGIGVEVAAGAAVGVAVGGARGVVVRAPEVQAIPTRSRQRAAKSVLLEDARDMLAATVFVRVLKSL